MKNNTKWLAALLFVSVAFNIYFVGTLLGHKGLIKLHRPDHESRFSMRQLTSGLPKDIRRQIGDAIKAQHETLLGFSNKKKELRTKIIELLSAEEVDVVALRKVFEQQRIITGEIQTPAHEALLAILPTVDQKTRQTMIEHMQRRMRDEKRHSPHMFDREKGRLEDEKHLEEKGEKTR